jgi:hypothetical protein
MGRAFAGSGLPAAVQRFKNNAVQMLYNQIALTLQPAAPLLRRTCPRLALHTLPMNTSCTSAGLMLARSKAPAQQHLQHG